VYRSRSCQYVHSHSTSNEEERNPFFSQQCQNCQNYLIELDKKYMGGKVLYNESNPLLADQIKNEASNQESISASENDESRLDSNGEIKRKRGRPKGSKNKSYHLNILPREDKTEENDENDPSLADEIVEGDRVLVKSDDPDFIYGNEDIALDENSEPSSSSEAVKINLQKGLRKRITTKRQKALLETKRKRGRPPIKVGPIDCSDCKKVFDNVKEYRKHCIEHINSFACSFDDCVKRFKSQKELDIHHRKHRGEKPYVCTDCGKAYAIRQDLRLHYRTQHTGGRPFKCSICPKAFARAHQLAVHSAVHTGEKAHLCSECGNSFSSVSSLIDHRKRRHLVVRNNKCDICPKAFFTKQELIAHTRTHTGDKPFQCLTCGKCFARPHHLKRHQAGVHNREKLATKKLNTLRDNSSIFYTTSNETVLFTTDEISGETVLIKEFDYHGDGVNAGTSFVVQAEQPQEDSSEVIQNKDAVVHPEGVPDKDQTSVMTSQPPQFAASSLLQLSQSKEDETMLVHPDAVIEIDGNQEGGYVLVTTGDEEQKLMAISQLSNYLTTTGSGGQSSSADPAP